MINSTTRSTPLIRIVPGSNEAAGAGRSSQLLVALLETGHALSYAGDNGKRSDPQDPDLILNLTPKSHPSAKDSDESQLFVESSETEETIQRVQSALAKSSKAREPSAHGETKWTPWFPVIDFSRCTNCMQCLSFCLFDVYGIDETKQITVQNPDKCKTNCPACSRVCPEVAILFPKYTRGPINGADIDQADVDHEKMKTDISALLGGDIYSMLRERTKRATTRFSKERDDDLALRERIKCLKKLGQEMDFPEEVLSALPSRDEIERKTQQVLARHGPEAEDTFRKGSDS